MSDMIDAHSNGTRTYCQGDIKRMYLTNVKGGKEWTTRLAKQARWEILRVRSGRRGRRRVSVYAVMFERD